MKKRTFWGYFFAYVVNPYKFGYTPYTEVESQLFLKCKKHTQENEYVRMSWISAPDNKRAHSFFNKMGGIQELD